VNGRGKSWNRKEIRLLRELYSVYNKTIKEIAEELNRPYESVRSKLKQLY
jgi:hypothetical protein